MNAKLRLLILFLVVCPAMLVPAQVSQTATWIGGNTFGSYSNVTFWTPNLLPLNTANTNFTLLVKPDSSLSFDLSRRGSVTALNLQEGAQFVILTNSQFSVNGVALIGGPLYSFGSNALFEALANSVSIGPLATLAAQDGGKIRLGASSYNLQGDYRGFVTFFSSDGFGSLLDLSSLQSLQVFGGWWNGNRNDYVYSITADHDGVIDLSGVGILFGAQTDAYDNNDWLELNLRNGGNIKLDNLQQSNRRVRYNIAVPTWSLPRLTSLSYLTEINLGSGTKLSMPSLLTGDGVSFNVTESASIEAPALTKLSSTTLNLGSSSSFNATNLTQFRYSSLSLIPGRNLSVPPFKDIDGSFFAVGGGSKLKIGASTYNFQDDYRGSATFFSADGAGSLLDFGSLQTLQVFGGWWNGNRNDFVYTISADNNGIVDLSGLGTVIGARRDAYDDNDWLLFSLRNGGNILLDSLQVSRRRVRFDINVPTYALPLLQSCELTEFYLAQDVVLNVPSLTSFSGGMALGVGAAFRAPKLENVSGAFLNTAFNGVIDVPSLKNISSTALNIDFGGTLNAPALETLTYSSLGLSPGKTLNAPSLKQINGSFLGVSGGSVIRSTAKEYQFQNDYRGSATFLSADGAGSLLDLSLMESLQVFGGWWNGNRNDYTYSISADNNGVIDLSHVETLLGALTDSYDNNDWLELNVRNGGNIKLDRLQQTFRRIRFNVGVPHWSLPQLKSVAYKTDFNVGTGNMLELPSLISGDGVDLNISDGATVDAPNLAGLSSSVINIGTGASLHATNLTQFTYGSLGLSPGRTFDAPPLNQIDGTFLGLSGGVSLQVAAKSYNFRDDYRGFATMFAADGAGTLLDLSKLETIQVFGGWWNGNRNDYVYSITADNGSTIDLSGLKTVLGARRDAYDDNDWLEFNVRAGATMLTGDTQYTRKYRVIANGSTATYSSKGMLLNSSGYLQFSGKAKLRLLGDFRFDHSNPADISLSDAIVQIEGDDRLRNWEVGGTDGGASGFVAGNFGIGQLVCGTTNVSSIVGLRDVYDNGHRGGGGKEALYLYGVDGVGLRLLGGSRLILNGLSAYGLVNGQMVRLNDLIVEGRNSVAFDQGVIATTGGAAITNMSPEGSVLGPVSAVEVSFDIPIQGSSLTAADVVMKGPNGTIAVSAVTPVGGNTYRIQFPVQTAHGEYRVQVGPNVTDLAGLLTQMDQDGDGLAGEAVEDVFTGVFLIDTKAPVLVSASALNDWGEVTVCFDEPLDPVLGVMASHYQVNGINPTNVFLTAGGRTAVLQTGALLGDNFVLGLEGVADRLSNTMVRASFTTNTIRPWRVAIIGVAGDPSTPGDVQATCEEDGVDVVAGGSSIWNNQDGFTYVYEPRAGNFDVRVRVEGFLKGAQFSEAGLMVREDLTPQSRHAYAYGHPSDGANGMGGMAVRSSYGGSTVEWPGRLAPGLPMVTPDAWMRMSRNGNVLKVYQSTNGTEWIQYGETTLSLPTSIYLGLASSANNGNAVGSTTSVKYREYGDYGPSILVSPESQTVSNSLPVTFNVYARGVAPLKYQWFFNQAPIARGTNGSYGISSVKVSDVGAYFVVVSNSVGVVTSKVAELVVDNVGVGGFEGDVGPRPNGNGQVSTVDWVQVGRFVAGLDTVVNSSEFARADCAPRSSLGDGRLTVSDWTQAGRYAAGLDTMTNTGGPRTAVLTPPAPRLATLGKAERRLSVEERTVEPGGEVEVAVKLEAVGNENAIGFSVQFDPRVLNYGGVKVAPGLENAVIQVNEREVGQGRLGVMMGQGAGLAFGKGSLELVRIAWRAKEERNVTVLKLGDEPVVRELASVGAEVVEAEYENGRVIVGKIPQLVAQSVGGQIQLELWGELSKTYRIESSSDLKDWSEWKTVKTTAQPMTLTPPQHDHKLYFRCSHVP